MRAPFLTGLALGAALLLLPLAALGDPPGRAPVQPTPGLLTLPASPTPAPQPVPSPGQWDAAQTLGVLGRSVMDALLQPERTAEIQRELEAQLDIIKYGCLRRSEAAPANT